MFVCSAYCPAHPLRNACTQCWNAVGIPCEFLLYSGTVCVHFYYIQALFWLHLHTFVCVCMCLYVLVGRVAPQTRMLFRRTLYQNVPVLILLKINDMGPYGIHLTKWHLISRHHGEIYTTRSVQSRPPQFQQPQDRTEHRTHHVDFLTLGSMCLLIFIISTLTFRSRSC